MTTRALVLAGGGLTGISWEAGLLVGLADAGIDVRHANLIIGTSAGSTVAAQITSSLTTAELFQRQVDPALQSKELTVQPDFQKIITDFNRIFQEGKSSRDILQSVGKLALATPTIPEDQRRAVIASRLPSDKWPQSRVEIIAVDASSGERVIFTRETDVDLLDAVTASCAIPCVWPPATVADRRYIDGGTYSMANADLATAFDKVLILQPDTPPFPAMQSLDEQIARLQQHGSQVEVITSDQRVQQALAATGGNALDPSLRAVAARAGRTQAQGEIARITDFWQ